LFLSAKIVFYTRNFNYNHGYTSNNQVAMASANPALSCWKYFPTFIRTIPPEHFQDKGRVAIVKYFKWKKVAVLREDMDTFEGLSNDLVYRLKKAGVEVSSYQTFSNDAELQIEELQVWRN